MKVLIFAYNLARATDVMRENHIRPRDAAFVSEPDAIRGRSPRDCYILFGAGAGDHPQHPLDHPYVIDFMDIWRREGPKEPFDQWYGRIFDHGKNQP